MFRTHTHTLTFRTWTAQNMQMYENLINVYLQPSSPKTSMALQNRIATFFETVTANRWMSTAWATTKKSCSRMVAMIFSHIFRYFPGLNCPIYLRRCNPSIGDVQLIAFKLHPAFVSWGPAHGMLKKQFQTAWRGLQPAGYERQSPPELDTKKNSFEK